MLFRFREHMAGVHGQKNFDLSHVHLGAGAAAVPPAPHR